jgi:hypothetical protein
MRMAPAKISRRILDFSRRFFSEWFVNFRMRQRVRHYHLALFARLSCYVDTPYLAGTPRSIQPLVGTLGRCRYPWDCVADVLPERTLPLRRRRKLDTARKRGVVRSVRRQGPINACEIKAAAGDAGHRKTSSCPAAPAEQRVPHPRASDRDRGREAARGRKGKPARAPRRHPCCWWPFGMACAPRRSATFGGSNSSSPRRRCTSAE